MSKKYLRPTDAAKYLDSSTSTLAKLRTYGGGPTYIKAGRSVRYALEDLDKYMAARKAKSTTETTGGINE